MSKQAILELARPKKQNVWGSPAVALFTLGGAASGLYLLSFLNGMFRQEPVVMIQHPVIKLIPPVMVCLGFFLITLEAGRPLRGGYMFKNLQSSWMSREIFVGVIFIITSSLDWLFPAMWLQILSSAAAFSLIVTQAFILYHARAVRAWNTSLILPLSLTSSISLGAGLLLAIAGLGGLLPNHEFLLAGLVSITLDLLVWLLYLRTQRRYSDPTSAALLNRSPLYFITVIGHLIPISVLSLILLGSAPSYLTTPSHLLLICSGLSAIAGGIAMRKCLIREAGYFREIVLGRA